jgi:hypothetical protein
MDTALTTFLLASVAIIHTVCVYLIKKFIRNKPLGMQTLGDLFLINALNVQSLDVIIHATVLNLAVLSKNPTNENVAIFLAIVADVVLTVDVFFLFFNVFIKYVCIYHSSIQEMIPDSKIIKTIWMFSTILSLFLVMTEYTFIREIESSLIYNCLRHEWSGKQEARYFVNLIFFVIVFIYLYLQIRIKGCPYLNSKSQDLFKQFK